MKKTLALLMAVVMVIGLFAGCTPKTPVDTTPKDTTPVAPTEPGAVSGSNKYSTDFATNSVDAGSITTALGEIGGGECGRDVYAGVEGKDYTDPEVYTFRDYTPATTNLKWGPLNWETNEDSYILDYTTTGFYAFALNSDKSGWSIVPEMAAEMPVDVTADYVGQYGIQEGETAKAWKIALNPNACWDNGEPINADTYLYSYKQLLDPIMKNRRADSLYAGNFVIVNAMDYFYQGQTVAVDNVNFGYTLADLVKGADGVYTDAEGNKAYIAIGMPLDWLGGETLATYVGAYGADYFDVTTWEDLAALADDNGLIPLTDDALALFVPVITGNSAWGETEEDAINYFAIDQTYPEVSFDEVGIIKTGDYELVMITTAPTENPNYYVPYNLSGTYLVYEPLFESCKTFFDSNGKTVTADAEDIASITTTYSTSKDTSISYGPYKLTYFELDKQFTLDRNENWYGYSDGQHLGQYQTDTISVQVIPEHSTTLLAFLKGDLDNVSLASEDMADYGTSDYVRYNPQSYTTKMTFNIDPEKLAERGTAVLANANFRKAFSLAIDRSTFTASYTSAGAPGYGLLNYMYIYDPYTGATYRDTEGAMDALVQLYGLTYGDDGEYGSLEEAYDAITGYDMDTAKALMVQAYDECVAAGYYDGTSNIELEFSVYQSDDIYVKMFNFFKDALTTACEGSGFEGKISMKMTVDADYYETMYSGNTDMIFTTWGGAASDPYSMLDQVYCDASDGSGNQNEYGFDTTKISVSMIVDGEKFTNTLKNWAAWAGAKDVEIKGENGTVLQPFGVYDAETRANFFSKLEYAYLSFYPTTPLYYRNSAVLVSQKGDYAVQQYVDTVAFGGIQFYTYNYTDAEWADVAAAGLTY